jgi:hypothetical protein
MKTMLCIIQKANKKLYQTLSLNNIEFSHPNSSLLTDNDCQCQNLEPISHVIPRVDITESINTYSIVLFR